MKSIEEQAEEISAMLNLEHEQRMSEIARRKEALRREKFAVDESKEGEEGKHADESKHAEGKWDEDGFATEDAELKIPDDAPIWNELNFENAY